MTKRYWLIRLRKMKGLTQCEVAEMVGVARTTYAMIESNERNPSVKVAKKIAKALNFRWVIFFEEEVHEMCI
ncbi:helix-turn-helix transcriptional regulator [Alkalibacillus haloalkaliphilus]|uniref:helix-turn-helix transcriptional regulator n=1 Tax=Alkalibacillus haloalkaliphilus TaxID=94136 RepID=UPI00031A212D|nr:helix-turn-helix transcriptional regulator [Alkalibacillus haloalkaliphilus]